MKIAILHPSLAVRGGADNVCEKELKALTKDLGLAEKVEFLGFVPDEGLREIYSGARTVIYIPYDEPFGLVFAEAAANRKAVIAPNHGGPAEIVVDGATGLLVDPSDPQDIAQAIQELWGNPERAHHMGEAGYRRAKELFSMDQFVERFEKLLIR